MEERVTFPAASSESWNVLFGRRMSVALGVSVTDCEGINETKVCHVHTATQPRTRTQRKPTNMPTHTLKHVALIVFAIFQNKVSVAFLNPPLAATLITFSPHVPINRLFIL